MAATKALLLSMPWAYYDTPSLSIGCLASYAQKKGFDVKALHLHLEVAALLGLSNYSYIIYGISCKPTLGDALCSAFLFPEKKEIILNYVEKEIPIARKLSERLYTILRRIYKKKDWSRYNLIGFTVNYEQLFASLIMAKWIKQDYPYIRIVLGGMCVASELGVSIIRNFSQIDWCVDGEGELAFIKLLSGIDNHRDGFEVDVPGLVYRQGSRVIKNERIELPDLINMPDPDFDHYFSLIDTHPNLRDCELSLHVGVEESRGCAYRCHFCADRSLFQHHRVRPPVEVAASIARMSMKYHIHTFHLVTAMVLPYRCKELFSHISAHKANYTIFCEIRAGLSKGNLLLMRKAGATEVQIGIEALDTKLLNKMNKGTRLIDNLQIMKYCEELGINHNSNLILAFPTESQPDINRSAKAIDYALGYMPPLQLVSFGLHDGSNVYFEPKSYGIDKIYECGSFSKFLPKEMSRNLCLWYKNFKSNRKPRNYQRLRQRWKRWCKSYENAKISGCPALYFLDCKGFLRIKDSRDGSRSITLDGWARELYLFCDSIKSFDEIKKRFYDVSERELKRTLNKLFKLKVMFKEGNDWLSLAIHASPENRRHMPFL